MTLEGTEKTTPAGDGTQGEQVEGDNHEETPSSGLGEDIPAKGTKGSEDSEDGGEDAKPGDKKDKETPDENFGKPEAYNYKDVQLPEGLNLDADSTKEFNKIASELNLSQKSANKFMEMAIKHTQVVQSQMQSLIEQAQQDQVNTYKQALNTDKEIGGAKLKESLQVANLAYEKFATEEFKDVMESTGLKYHPAVIKMFRSLGAQMEEDNIYSAKVPHGTEQSAAQILYGSKGTED